MQTPKQKALKWSLIIIFHTISKYNILTHLIVQRANRLVGQKVPGSYLLVGDGAVVVVPLEVGLVVLFGEEVGPHLLDLGLGALQHLHRGGTVQLNHSALNRYSVDQHSTDNISYLLSQRFKRLNFMATANKRSTYLKNTVPYFPKHKLLIVNRWHISVFL